MGLTLEHEVDEDVEWKTSVTVVGKGKTRVLHRQRMILEYPKKTDYYCVRRNYSLDENSTRLILKNHRLHQSPTMIILSKSKRSKNS